MRKFDVVLGRICSCRRGVHQNLLVIFIPFWQVIFYNNNIIRRAFCFTNPFGTLFFSALIFPFDDGFL